MKDILSQIFTSLKQNKIKAFNYSRTRDDSVCFNLIEVPDSIYTIVTISVMKNKRKSASLHYVSFVKLMSELENLFFDLEISLCYNSPPCFVPLRHELNDSWYKLVDCHRLFIIPTEYVFDVLKALTKDRLRHILEFKCGVRELSFYVNTSTHNLKLTRFNKEENYNESKKKE